MEIITSNYQQFKQALDQEMQKEAEGFVKIGYLLRIARDTEVLHGSGYENVNDFAKKEYGLDTSQVSRFIAINEKFSVGGYSGELEDHYEGFGVAKLSIMLQLPDKLNEELTPDFTKSEINTLKEEVKAEAKITDIEVMAEGRTDDMVKACFLEILKDSKLFKAASQTVPTKELKEVLAPSGMAIYTVRIMGKGRVMVKIDETDEVKFIFVRTNETEKREFYLIEKAIREIVGAGNYKDNYRNLYGTEIEEEKPAPPKENQEKSTVKDISKIAPVQKKTEAPKKEPKVKPAPVPKVKPEEAEEIPPEKVEKADNYSMRRESEVLRKELAEQIAQLNGEDIKGSFLAERIIFRLKKMLELTERIVIAETEERDGTE